MSLILDDLWDDGAPIALPEVADAPTIQVTYTELELHLSAIADEPRTDEPRGETP